MLREIYSARVHAATETLKTSVCHVTTFITTEAASGKPQTDKQYIERDAFVTT